MTQERLSLSTKIFAVKKARYLERVGKDMEIDETFTLTLQERNYGIQFCRSPFVFLTFCGNDRFRIAWARDSGHNDLYDRRKPFSYAY